ncbi:MAG: phosphomethylpyrimidine synthase ThiC, partial [Bacteroidota bacterium]
MTKQFEIKNASRLISPIRVGDDIPKIVVNLGMTSSRQTVDEEIRKAQTAVKYGASIIADVSTVGNIRNMHKALMENVDKPLNVVPLYEIYQQAHSANRWNNNFARSEVLEVIEAQAESGVDCMTLHSSYKSEYFERVRNSPRRIRIQGKGGGLIHEFFIRAGARENPLYEYFDDILKILKKHHVALSLGSCLRNGTVDDPIDHLIELELITWAELVNRASEQSVNVMVEGLSHIRFGLIQSFVRWVKNVCHGVPLRLLGPLGTEKGLGYDHITAAICTTEAVRSGVDLITCVTQAEHIGLPKINEIREAVVAT